MRTLFLSPEWDLVVDRDGNIAVCSEPYAQAQDAASEIRTFQGECYFDIGRGISYWTAILGKLPPAALMKSYFVRAALLVPGVVKARCFLTSVDPVNADQTPLLKRTVQGQVQITSSTGLCSFLGF